MAEINKQVLEHLAKLARMKLEPEEEEKLLKDLEGILEYFNELKSLDTSGVEGMNGGTLLANIFRDDEERSQTNMGKGVDQFPKSKDGYLEVPSVFEQ